MIEVFFPIVNIVELTRNSAIRLLDQAITSAIASYAVRSCHTLCSRMLLLPRELRDMIYDSTLDRIQLQKLRWQAERIVSRHAWSHVHRLAHYLQVEYVGGPVLFELSQHAAECNYKYQSFEIASLKN